MVNFMENPIKMDDLGGNTPIFGNTHIMSNGLNLLHPRKDVAEMVIVFCVSPIIPEGFVILSGTNVLVKLFLMVGGLGGRSYNKMKPLIIPPHLGTVREPLVVGSWCLWEIAHDCLDVGFSSIRKTVQVHDK